MLSDRDREALMELSKSVELEVIENAAWAEIEEPVDHDAESHDWETCQECIDQAKRDGILGPDE